MKSYCDACPEEVKGFSKEVEDLVGRLTQVLENQFKEDVKVRGTSASHRVSCGKADSGFRGFISSQRANIF